MNIFNSCFSYIAVWFGLVDKIKTTNRTKPCGWVKNWSKCIRTKCGFGLDWFGLRFFYWNGSILNTPNVMYVKSENSLYKNKNTDFIYVIWDSSYFSLLWLHESSHTESADVLMNFATWLLSHRFFWWCDNISIFFPKICFRTLIERLKKWDIFFPINTKSIKVTKKLNIFTIFYRHV